MMTFPGCQFDRLSPILLVLILFQVIVYHAAVIFGDLRERSILYIGVCQHIVLFASPTPSLCDPFYLIITTDRNFH
jgi:hypothetical protein